MTLLVAARLCAFWSVMNATGPAQSEPEPIRLISTRHMHVGLRAHANWGEGAALTIQVSTDGW